MTFGDNLKRICKERGTSPTAIMKKWGLSTSKVSAWYEGSLPKQEMLLRLATELNCSVMDFFADDEYLSQKTVKLNSGDNIENPTINDNHGIIGHAHAPVTIINGSERTLSNQEVALLNIFDQLSVMEQARLLVFAEELKENSK